MLGWGGCVYGEITWYTELKVLVAVSLLRDVLNWGRCIYGGTTLNYLVFWVVSTCGSEFISW